MNNENDQQHAGGRRELLEKTIAKILHRHCNFGWANYYIPSEKFPSLIEELVEVMSPGGQAGHEELVQFFLGVQRLLVDPGARSKARAGIFGIQARLKFPLND